MTSPHESETGTEELLKDVGNSLLNKLSSVDQLLNLLDKLERLLSTLEQEPTRSVQDALLPSMKALISVELLRHSDEEVKIAVTACITEISRITAPDAPYNDDQMKEIFKLTVSSFENLSDVSGRCYEKAIAILDNVARVRLCLVMLDLECDELIIEMFQLFLRIIRSNHPCIVISSMEIIMTMVLNESEEISLDLLRPLLDSIRKENQTVSPISWTLGEKVITNCAVKLKPYLMKAVLSTGIALDDYAQIVISICHDGSETLEHNHSNDPRETLVQADEDKLDVCNNGDEQSWDVTKGLQPEMNCVEDVAQGMVNTKSNMNNAHASNKSSKTIKKESSKRQQHSDHNKNPKSNKAKPNSKTGKSKSGREPKSETELDAVPKKRGRKPNSLMNPEEGYDHSWIRKGRKAAKSAQSRKARDSSIDIPPSVSPDSKRDMLPSQPASEALVSQPKSGKSTKSAQSRKDRDSGADILPSENPASRMDKLLSHPENMSEALVSQPKIDKNADAAPPSTNHSTSDGSRPKRGRPKKRSKTGNQDVDPNSVSMLKEDQLDPQPEKASLEPPISLEKDSEVKKVAEVKPRASVRKIKFTLKPDEKITVASESLVAEMESKISNEGEEKPKSVMNIEVANVEAARSSVQTGVKKRRRLNATCNKVLNESSASKELITESATKTLNGVDKTPQTRPRRKCTTGSDGHDFSNSLVGSRIKVWWPMDKKFYKGVVDSYAPGKGKHKILYADGDVEVLNLKKQRWELISDDVSPNLGRGTDLQKLEEASDTAQKSKGKSKSESNKGTNGNSRSRRGRASAKSDSVKSAGKSVDDFAIDEPVVVDESVNDAPRTDNKQDSAGKSKTKKLRTGSDIKKNKPETEHAEMTKPAVA